MDKYRCEKCNSTKVYLKPTRTRIGMYCSECGGWISYITYKDAIKFHKEMAKELKDESITVKTIIKRSGYTMMRCSKCGCLLYNSCLPKVQGQFNLVDANFCPKCGTQLA